jgi:hypothetical protein
MLQYLYNQDAISVSASFVSTLIPVATFLFWDYCPYCRRNVGHAGTCNNTGYVLSLFFGFVLFIVLSSKNFSNKFRVVPQERGFVTFSGEYTRRKCIKNYMGWTPEKILRYQRTN